MHEKTIDYHLRNEKNVRFTIHASCANKVTRARIARNDGLQFQMEVRFEGEYAETKPHFDDEMWLETALSLIKSQIESYRFEDTEIVLSVNSGLPKTKIAGGPRGDAPGARSASP